MFIFFVIVTVAAGFFIYIEKHGTTDVAGADIDISAGQAILMDEKTGKLLASMFSLFAMFLVTFLQSNTGTPAVQTIS